MVATERPNEALFEFVTRADFIGMALERVPLLGPVRRAAREATRAAIDARAGDSIRAFLGGYSAQASTFAPPQRLAQSLSSHSDGWPVKVCSPQATRRLAGASCVRVF